MIVVPRSSQEGLVTVKRFHKVKAKVQDETYAFIYTVTVSAGDKAESWEVVKGHADFEQLQNGLLKQGYFVPLLPHKRNTTNDPTDPAFVERKRKYLSAWLRELFSSDDIKQSSEFKRYFQNKQQKSAAKPATSPKAVISNEDFIAGKPPSSPTDNKLLVGVEEKKGAAVARLKDFTLIQVIGKGSFGKVMLVRKNDTRAIYAMKVLNKDNVIKRNQVEHTKTERSVLEYIRHPFIVTLRFAFQTKLKLYFVLDYCPGGELFFHLGRAGRFSENQARFYTAQIIMAIEYLHGLGVVYRDLKPENVLLDELGNIALTDFGLSKEGIEDNSSATSFCGTPEYLAPEILTRAGHGRAADWWSLGALLFEMLTGMPPFYSRNRDRLFHKILKAQLRLPKFFSPEATELLTGLLNRDPNARIGSERDAEELKTHAFFQSVNWADLLEKKLKPPFKPDVKEFTDTSNFDKEFTNMALDSVDDSASSLRSVASVSEGKFAGFTFVNPDKHVPER